MMVRRILLGGIWLSAVSCLACASPEPVDIPARPDAGDAKATRAMGTCPPFHLRDEAGNVIDPVQGVNADVPYSPKRTCGASGCHDYERITKGYHFQQGADEAVPAAMAERYGWVSHPGNYGGNWCSPAPLYNQLAPKKNQTARTIDMTSFSFITAGCGTCHPGGGPMEFDREGKRYDHWMADPASGLVPGGDNGLDGDYYQARWSESGVLEADCLLCHQPNYDFKARNAALADLNFRWAATAGAGLGKVAGKVKAGEGPTVAYDLSRFNDDGTLKTQIVPSPRNETCLTCHGKPGWKKRGASFSPRTDVHMAAGLRCVDCHAAGSKAADPRINRREEHQFGKGDDPSGWVRNDLDDTVRSCASCHIDGWRNAPRAQHAWLPPLHLHKLSCEACHIPTRAVKAALVQASDAWNDAPRIKPPPKHVWTFYDQDMRFWNHYGELDLFTRDDQPTDVFRPSLIRYKGRIFPANRVHSAWVGFQEEGKPGLNQILMKDFYQMWAKHREDPENAYPELARITDDNGDGAMEVNRPDEIDALLAATARYLADTAFPMAGRRLVWVSDSRACFTSSDCFDLPREPHEATAYASVYKYAHDVAPAKAALGAGGCTDCHRSGAHFFQGATLERPFDENGNPVWTTNAAVLGIGPAWVALGNLREGTLKPLLYGLLALLGAVASALGLRRVAERGGLPAGRARLLGWLVLAGAVVGLGLVAVSPGLAEYMTVRRFALDANHFWVGVAVIVLALWLAVADRVERPGALAWATFVAVVWAGLCGAAMVAGSVLPDVLARLAYTGFDAGLVVLAALSVAGLLARMARSEAVARCP